MDYIIRNVTRNLLEKLPDSQSYFKLNDLESHGIPDFVVDRIQVELENNLAESLVPPDTDWANMNTESVQFAWNQFVRAIRAETRLPASYASTVMETSVGDIIDILIQPRKNIPEIIYGNDDKLSYEELTDRIKYIVVYTYLADALPRYMARKQLNELSKEKTKKIIQQIDERLTARYTPLNWAQLLEPWFKLMGDNLDSDAVKLFFEDKGQQKIAKLFQKEEDSINRTRLIEILSNPDLSLREGEKAFSGSGQSSQSVFAGSQQSAGREEPESASQSSEPQEESEQEKERYRSDADARLEEAKKRLEQLKGQSPSVTESGTPEESEEATQGHKTTEEQQEEEQQEVPLSQMYGSEEEEEPNEQAAEEYEASVDDTTGQDEDESEEEEAPIWQRFVSGEEEDEESPAAEPDEDEVDRLANFLSYSEDRFINELFGGEPGAYRDALEKLVAHDDWKSAGRYLHKQIFAPRGIDMYDEAAVDFTDQLQDYFTEMKK